LTFQSLKRTKYQLIELMLLCLPSTPWGQFNQRSTSNFYAHRFRKSSWQSLFRFWDLRAQKLRVEHWWNWHRGRFHQPIGTKRKYASSRNKEFLIYWKKFFFEEAPSDSQVVWAIDLIQGLCEMFFVFMWLLLTGKCYIQTTYLAAVH